MSLFSSLKVGVLALQGAFAKHEKVLASVGAKTVQVRTPTDLELCDGLIIPGGESTTILRQMHFIELVEPILEFAKNKPIFGTCAGMILISKEIVGGAAIKPLGLMDIVVERNAYGRQAESFFTELEVTLPLQKKRELPAFFIRAPRIRACGSEVTVLAKFLEDPVLVLEGNKLASSFHSELTDDPTIHEYFLTMIQASKKK